MTFFFEDELEETPPPPSSSQSPVGRHLARSGARIGEAIAGLPGDIISLGTELPSSLARLAGAPEQSIETAQSITSQLFPQLTQVPGSEDIREQVTEKLSGEYLKPQSKKEEISDEIISDATSLFLPGKGAKGLKSGKRLLGALGIAGGATGLGEFAEKLGAGEKGKAATKLGAMLLLSTLGVSSPKKYYSRLYNKAEEAIPKKASLPAYKLGKELSSLKNKLQKGLDSPSEKAVLGKIEKLQDKIRGNKIRVDEVWASKRSLNEDLGKMVGEAKSGAQRRGAKNLFKKITRSLNEELADYGKHNKEFGKYFKEAEEAYRVTHQSELIGNSLKKLSHYKPSSFLLYPLIHGAAGAGVGKAAAALAGYKGGQVAYRLMKSPSLRKYYGQVLKSAAARDGAALNRALEKLDKEMVKEYPESTQRYVLE